MGGCETTPPDSRTDPRKPAPHVHGKPQPNSLSSLAIIGRRSPASSSFLLAAARLRGLQLDPRPRSGTKPAAARKPSTTANPAITRSPGQDSPRSLTAKAPMGGRYRRGAEPRRGGGNDSHLTGIAVLAVEPLARPPQAGTKHVDLPADLPLHPRCQKPASWRPRITPWVSLAALWVCIAAGPGRIAKRRRPGSPMSRPGRSRHSRRLPPGK